MKNTFLRAFSTILIVLTFSVTSQAKERDILFDGYSKVVSQGAPLGYVISKYEYDSKEKKFFSTYYLKTNSNLTESLKAVADGELNPISYEYTAINGKDIKTIDAKFTKGKLIAVVKNNGKVSKVEKKMKPGVFLSTFLYYMMLKSPSGLQPESKYNFEAIAEEDADVTTGSASVLKLEKYHGIDAYRVKNVFKNIEYTSFLTEKGEIIGTDSKSQGISTELVSHPIEATQGFAYNEGTIKTLFGTVPVGLRNPISENTQPIKKSEEKSQGTGTKGLMDKTQPPQEHK